MESKYIVNEISIQASVSEVWDMLVNPAKTPLYMFACEVISSWTIGSEVLWKGKADGIIYVRGELVEWEPEKIFAFTVFDPNASYPDIPENYLTAKYELTANGDLTHLKVTQGNYTKVAEGGKRYQDTMSQGGWGSVLEGIKKELEG